MIGKYRIVTGWRMLILAFVVFVACHRKDSLTELQMKEQALAQSQQSYNDTIAKLQAENRQLKTERDALQKRLDLNSNFLKSIQSKYEGTNRFSSADQRWIEKYFADSLY